MVAEKPSICTAIASALAGSKLNNLAKTPPIYEFQGQFKGQNVLYR